MSTNDIISMAKNFAENAQKASAAAFINSAQKGHLQEVKNYLEQHQRCEHLLDEQLTIFKNMISSPDKFVRKEQLVELILESGFDAIGFFKKAATEYPEFEKDLWKIFARKPDIDTARAGGMLMAEYIRYRICQHDEVYQIPLNALLQSDGSLKSEDETRKTQESIIAVQNSLANYVTEKGPNMVINRGAGFLHVMDEHESSDVWLRQLISLPKQFSMLPRVIFKPLN